VDNAGVRDASTYPVPGFLYLRTDRFLAALGARIEGGDQKTLWVRLMQQHDLVAREKEISNLSEAALKRLALKLGQPPDRTLLMNKIKFYSEKSWIHDQERPNFYEALMAVRHVPDEYSMTLRTLGLYPLWSLPVANATGRVYDEFRKWHHTPPAELKIDGKLRTYAPRYQVTLAEQEILQMFQPSQRNALGLPQLSEVEIERLVSAHAPIFNQDIVADYDNIGQIIWNDKQVRVDPLKPVVYYYITYAFFKGEPVLQLNYAFWYLGRDGPNPPSIERGPLDGITVRITFDPQGQPVMSDIMNNCGCYYFFVPRKERVKRIIPQPKATDPLAPAWLPQSFPQKRLKLRINPGWHQVQHVDAGEIPPDGMPYELVAYDALEMLPHPDGRTESIFDATGIAKDSPRLEPLIFFPSGIHDIGSMRQRGHHAIKLVGRAHFDDPELFDKSFEFN